MLRRRFYQSYKSPINNGVYAVRQDGRLIPLSRADNSCISVAIIYDGHKIMIEKNEDSNQSYKTATSDLPDSSNKTYFFYWGEHGTDQIGITNYDKVDGINSFGFLKQESGSYGGTPNISENISSWTSGVLSDWKGKANSEVLKRITTGGGSYTSYATAGHVLNTFLASPDAKGYDDWYIPSCGELSLIYMHLTSVNNALSAIDGQQLTKDYYLSSSEYDPENFWIVLFNNGRVFKRLKRLVCRVRFVRKIE